MELLGDLGLGYATALSPFNLMYCFIGVLLGTAVGVLPGLGPVATIAMLLPITLACRRFHRSSCWPVFTTAPSMADRPPRS